MTVYARQIKNATRIIAAKGQLVTWVSQTNQTPPDTSKPWIPAANSEVQHPVKIVFLPVGYRSSRQKQYQDGSEVSEGEMYGLMAAVDFVPSLKDKILRSGETLNVVTIDPLSPDGSTIIYELELSK